MLRSWLRKEAGRDVAAIRVKSSRRRRRGDNEALSSALAADDDPFFIPVRVVWMPPANRQGRRLVRLSDLFKPGDPRDPYAIRARIIRYLRPKRVRLLAARGAFASEMVNDHAESERLDTIESYVTRRAWRSLDHYERQLQGHRYKIPRFVSESMLTRRELIDAIDAVAEEEGINRATAHAKAARYLKEIAATHSPYFIDITAGLIQKLYRQGYGAIRYSPAKVTEVAALSADHPVVFLPSHRSNLDRLSLQFTLWENDLPPNHTAGGINLNFFPVGPLIRRSGVFFIRRSFRGNRLYKTVLQAYLDYLIENRFPLEFYLEGGRSRSGKLLPPRMGMLSYVADSYQRDVADDVQLVPVSIAYDMIQDVPDYAREAQGKSKEKESVTWLLKAVRSLRRRYGDIYIEFGEPVAMSSHMAKNGGDQSGEIDLQKVAFEVMHRIGQATPVTPTALMSIALLEEKGIARTASELGARCSDLATFLGQRGVTLTETLDYTDTDVSTAVIEPLRANGYVSSHEALGRKVYWLDEDQMIKISYYRNMILHFFVPRAVGEMALYSLGPGPGEEHSFRRAVLALRDLLKFEFFFASKDAFVDAAHVDLAIDVPEWDETLSRQGPEAVIAQLKTSIAHWALLPLLDAYQVVGDELEALAGPYEEAQFLKACLARARMYRIEGKVISGESASQVLFKSALGLAANRGLLDEADGVTIARKEFASEVRTARALASRAS